MHIVLLTNILNPYRKAFYDELARQCKEMGHVFHVLVMSEREYNREWQYEDYKGDYSILLQCKAFRIKHLPIYWNPDLKKRLQQLNPDIVVMAGGYMLPSVWKASRYKIKLGYKTYFWSESHLDEKRNYDSLLLKIRELIRERFYKKMDGFWYPGEKALQLIQKYAKSDTEYYHIPNLIDNRRFKRRIDEQKFSKDEIRRKYGLSQGKVVLFAPMRLNWVKGLEPFMGIVSECKNREHIQLAVAGNGELEEKLCKKAEELSVDLKLLGYHEESEIIELYQGADAFFLSSLSDPSPLTCVEALWCGKPLFVSEYVGNYPEVIRQGENGYMYRYSDKKEAVKLLDTFVSAPNDWKKKASEVSLQIASEKFDLEKVTRKLMEEML